jgi:hypothetical protein
MATKTFSTAMPSGNWEASGLRSEMALFEIKARVIGDIKTLDDITSRHVEVKVLNQSLPAAISNADLLKVTAVTGESGSGKTYSVIAACHIANGATIIMVPNDFAEHSGERLLPVELKLMSRFQSDTLFLGCLDSFLAKLVNEDALRKEGKVLQESDVPITLLLDEMGETPSLIHAMCRQQGAVCALIKHHTKTTSSKFRLVAAGTGLSHGSTKFGSNFDWFEVVPAMPGVIFGP